MSKQWTNFHDLKVTWLKPLATDVNCLCNLLLPWGPLCPSKRTHGAPNLVRDMSATIGLNFRIQKPYERAPKGKFQNSESVSPMPYLCHELNMIIHTKFIHIYIYSHFVQDYYLQISGFVVVLCQLVILSDREVHLVTPNLMTTIFVHIIQGHFPKFFEALMKLKQMLLVADPDVRPSCVDGCRHWAYIVQVGLK